MILVMDLSAVLDETAMRRVFSSLRRDRFTPYGEPANTHEQKADSLTHHRETPFNVHICIIALPYR
jgi:hypothetical protein